MEIKTTKDIRKGTYSYKMAWNKKWVAVDDIKTFIMNEKKKHWYVELETKGAILDIFMEQMEDTEK